MAAKMATIVGNVTGPQQRHHPYNMPPLVEKINGFPLKVKSFRNTATLQKLKEGGGASTTPPLTLAALWGYEFACSLKKK